MVGATVVVGVGATVVVVEVGVVCLWKRDGDFSVAEYFTDALIAPSAVILDVNFAAETRSALRA